MKTQFSLILFFFLFVSITSKGQTLYSNYWNSSSEWDVSFEYWDLISSPCLWTDYNKIYKSSYRYFMNGDTTIGGKVYRKVYNHRIDSIFCEPSKILESATDSIKPWATVRETPDHKVFAYNGVTGSEFLLWDFDKGIGDTFVSANDRYDTCFVQRIDTIWVGGKPRRTFECHCGIKIIEGIGNVRGVFWGNICSGGIHGGLTPICYKLDGQVVPIYPGATATCRLGAYSSLDRPKLSTALQLFPNPAKGKIQLSRQNALNSSLVKIINPLGQVVKEFSWTSDKTEIDVSQLTPGIYFVNVQSKGGLSSISFVKE